MIIPPEPLELSAPLAREIAPRLCRIDPVSGDSCSWNHGFWQYLRLMDLAVTPANQADFYHRALQAVTSRNGAPRVLISGTTDYSMLAHVLANHRQRGIEAAVTVVDICETSLFLNRWYAERASARVACTRSDILDYDCKEPFDAVCTDSFLGQFATDTRVGLLQKWRQLLRPGAKAITVTRVRSTTDTAPVGFSLAQAQALRVIVARKAMALSARLQTDPAEIARATDLYLSKQRTWPVRSREEVRNLFESCGFCVDELSDTDQSTAARHSPNDPASPGEGEQVRIIATRL